MIAMAPDPDYLPVDPAEPTRPTTPGQHRARRLGEPVPRPPVDSAPVAHAGPQRDAGAQ